MTYQDLVTIALDKEFNEANTHPLSLGNLSSTEIDDLQLCLRIMRSSDSEDHELLAHFLTWAARKRQ